MVDSAEQANQEQITLFEQWLSNNEFFIETFRQKWMTVAEELSKLNLSPIISDIGGGIGSGAQSFASGLNNLVSGFGSGAQNILGGNIPLIQIPQLTPSEAALQSPTNPTMPLQSNNSTLVIAPEITVDLSNMQNGSPINPQEIVDLAEQQILPSVTKSIRDLTDSRRNKPLCSFANILE